MEARSPWPSIINEKTFSDFKRIAEQTRTLTKEPDHFWFLMVSVRAFPFTRNTAMQ
jgi:hypothetical protein